jgi:hypothetical protein
MRFAPLMAGAFVALAMTTAATPSQAATALPKLSLPQQSTVLKADWDDHHRWRRWHHRGPVVRFYGGGGGGGYGYCRSWRHECAERWGWGGWQFQRCLARHGC